MKGNFLSNHFLNTQQQAFLVTCKTREDTDDQLNLKLLFLKGGCPALRQLKTNNATLGQEKLKLGQLEGKEREYMFKKGGRISLHEKLNYRGMQYDCNHIALR